MLEYWWLIKRRFRSPLRQVVLRVGRNSGPASKIVEDQLRFHYETIDFRDLDAQALLDTGNHGDLAWAVLAGGGDNA